MTSDRTIGNKPQNLKWKRKNEHQCLYQTFSVTFSAVSDQNPIHSGLKKKMEVHIHTIEKV